MPDLSRSTWPTAGLVLLVAGCSSTPIPLDWPDIPPTGFTAEYASTETPRSVRFALGGPIVIVDADGVPKEHLQLTVPPAFDGGDPGSVYVDRYLRPQAYQAHHMDGMDEMMTLTYSPGGLGIFGIGMWRHVMDGRPTILQDGRSVPVEGQAFSDGQLGIVELEATPPRSTVFAGRYEFQFQEDAPTTMPYFERTSYHAGEPLKMPAAGAARPLDRHPLAVPAPKSGVDPLETGASLALLVDMLREQHPELDDAIEAGECMVHLSMRFKSRDSQHLAIVPVSTTTVWSGQISLETVGIRFELTNRDDELSVRVTDTYNAPGVGCSRDEVAGLDASEALWKAMRLSNMTQLGMDIRDGPSGPYMQLALVTQGHDRMWIDADNALIERITMRGPTSPWSSP